MKTLITLLVSILSLSLSAQNVNVTFQGANKNRNYQVVIDGASYYSANRVSTNARKAVAIPGLNAGSHTLKVYQQNTNNSVYTDGSTNARVDGGEIYSKTFELREGYDMNITVKANGMVSFTEKRSQAQSTAQNGVPMSSTAFNQLLVNVRNKRYQSDKITLITNAFNTSGNYFTTSQVRQLLVLVNAENRKLELAKLSYKKITDPANFSSVYNVLNSEAGRDSLDDYVVAQGGYTSTTTQNNTAYGTAMSDVSFNQLILKIKNKTYENDRLNEMKTVLSSTYNYFNTAQVKQLLTMITSETARLDLAKTAFARVVDRINFNQLVDLLYTQYNRDDLNNFIVSNGGVANNNTYRSPMTDASFTQAYNKARNHFFQKNTLTELRNAFNNKANYFSTEQVRQLLLLAAVEPEKLALAKLAYPRVVDTVNFSQLRDLFTIQSNRAELDIFVNAQQH